MQASNLYHVKVDSIPEKHQRSTSNNLLAKVKARPWLSAGVILLLPSCILALILGVVLGLRGASSNTSADSTNGGTSSGTSFTVSVPSVAPGTSFAPLQPNFVSFAIEYAYLPQFANSFSHNVLSNIANISGMMPYVRVGGDSADLAIYDGSQSMAVNITTQEVGQVPKFANVTIGPSFFESFRAWPDVKFIVGLNLKRATSDAAAEGMKSVLASVAASCSLMGDQLLWWEYGNEPDLYHRKPSAWDAATYVEEWQTGAMNIKEALQAQCPNMTSDEVFGFVGPSLFFMADRLPPGDIIANGYNKDGLVKEFALHHFMADCLNVTCNQQSMLMNHTFIKSSLANVTAQITDITDALPVTTNPPIAFILDEISMFLIPNAAPPGTSDTFGAALWALDFSLYCACIGISRTHMQQGLGFNYNSWSPVDLEDFPMDVYPVYYGNIAAASAIGDFTSDPEAPRVVELSIPNTDDFQSAYAIYRYGTTLSRIVVVNLNQFNETEDPSRRVNRTYTFNLPSSANGSMPLLLDGFSVPVARLTADGADSKDKVTYNGYSYQYSFAQGRAAKVDNGPGEMAVVGNHQIQISVPDSSAVLLDFQSGHAP